MNVSRSIAACLLLVSMNSLYAMQKEFVDDKSGRTITICEIEHEDLDPSWWETALRFTMSFHNRNIEEDNEANRRTKESYRQAQERFEKNPDMCLFSVIYDRQKMVGIGLVELIGDTIISCFTQADFKTYNSTKFMSEFKLFLKEKFSSAQSFAISAPKQNLLLQGLLKNLGFQETSDDKQHPIREWRLEDSQAFQSFFK